MLLFCVFGRAAQADALSIFWPHQDDPMEAQKEWPNPAALDGHKSIELRRASVPEMYKQGLL